MARAEASPPPQTNPQQISGAHATLDEVTAKLNATATAVASAVDLSKLSGASVVDPAAYVDKALASAALIKNMTLGGMGLQVVAGGSPGPPTGTFQCLVWPDGVVAGFSSGNGRLLIERSLLRRFGFTISTLFGRFISPPTMFP
jgi:hypothetical protein